jgi:hypothetical protein
MSFVISKKKTIKIKPSFLRKVSFSRTFLICLKRNMKNCLSEKLKWILSSKFQNELFANCCEFNPILYCTWQGRESTRSAISPSVEQNLLRGPPPHLSQHHPRDIFFIIFYLCKPLFLSLHSSSFQVFRTCYKKRNNFTTLTSFLATFAYLFQYGTCLADPWQNWAFVSVLYLCIQLVSHTRYILINFFYCISAFWSFFRHLGPGIIILPFFKRAT